MQCWMVGDRGGGWGWVAVCTQKWWVGDRGGGWGWVETCRQLAGEKRCLQETGQGRWYSETLLEDGRGR